MGMKKAALSTDFLSELKISPAEFIEGALLGLYTIRNIKKMETIKSLENVTVLADSTLELTDRIKAG